MVFSTRIVVAVNVLIYNTLAGIKASISIIVSLILIGMAIDDYFKCRSGEWIVDEEYE